MRILITQRELVQRAGSELFTIEVATELGKRGHDVAVFCPRLGPLADIMFAAGVWIKPRLAELPWVPEIIHGQHHLPTMAALAYFPKAPAVYHCHGYFPWVEQAPLHPRIRTYVMMCRWMVRLLEPKFGIPGDRVTVLPNFVDTKRFSQVRSPPDRPRRAVLFSNGGLPARELRRLESACRTQGLSLDRIGMAYRTQQPRPEIILPEYDLVFAVGKSALEAMACGCAVIPVIPGQAGHLITIENFEEWAHANFAPRYYASAAQIDTAWLTGELRNYSPKIASEVTAKVRREYALKDAIDRLEKIYQAAIDDHLDNGPGPDLAEFASYLEKLSLEVDTMWCDLEQLRRDAGLMGLRQDGLSRPIWRRRIGELWGRITTRKK
jgi:glycosyltransferase involved in cell wall biosynthesis